MIIVANLFKYYGINPRKVKKLTGFYMMATLVFRLKDAITKILFVQECSSCKNCCFILR